MSRGDVLDLSISADLDFIRRKNYLATPQRRIVPQRRIHPSIQKKLFRFYYLDLSADLDFIPYLDFIRGKETTYRRTDSIGRIPRMPSPLCPCYWVRRAIGRFSHHMVFMQPTFSCAEVKFLLGEFHDCHHRHVLPFTWSDVQSAGFTHHMVHMVFIQPPLGFHATKIELQK